MSKLKSIQEIEKERALEPNFGKGITVASGFDLGAKAPLDSRLTVKTIEERNAHVSGNRAYEGMLVYVEADKKTYQLINGAWEEFGFNEEKFQLGIQPVVDKNTEQDRRLEALEDLVVGDEGGGLSAIISDITKNKEDISELQTDLAAEIANRESADALINAEISKNKANIANLQTELEEEVGARESAIELINEELGKKADKTNLQAEIERATGVEQGLNTRLTTVEGKVSNNEDAIEDNAEAISQEVSQRKSEIARVEGLVAAEKQRAEGVEQELQANIDTKVATVTFEAEKTRVNGLLAEKATKVELNAEKERVDGLLEEVNTTLEGHESLIDTVTSLAQDNRDKKADKTQVATDIASGVAQSKTYADGKLVEAKTYADGKLVEGKTYTDGEIDKVEATISALDEAYKVADTQVLTAAKAHTDNAIARLVDGAPEALDTLNELAKALGDHEDEYDALLATVGTKANSADVYTKTQVDGIKTGLESSIGNIEKAYKAADTALSGRITALEDVVNGENGIDALNEGLAQAKEDIVANATQIATNKANISTNATAISKEVQDRTQAVAGVDSKITTERDRALAAENTLDGKISQANTEIDSAKSDIAKNASDITKEVQDRTQAVNNLNTKLNNMTPVTSAVQPVGKEEGHIWIEILG